MTRQASGVPDAHSTSARRVLIVGAGIAGPCLALSLAQHGIRSTLFEVRDSPSAGGGSISLGPNGLQVLHRYVGHGVYERLRADGFTYRRFVAIAENGDKFGEIKVGYDEGEGYPAVRVMRTTLHRILLDAVEEEQKRGMIQIRYGAKVARIEEGGDKVRAHFQDGSSAEGGCIIGADGTHSKVREHVLGDKAPSPTFDRLCVVYGFLPASSIARMPDAEASSPSDSADTDNPALAGSTFALPGFVWTAAGMFMVIPHDKSGEQLAWCIVRSVENDMTRAVWADFERSGEGARLAKADYAGIATEPLRSILDSSREEDARLWPSYSIPDIPHWSAGRACLIGDAAHAMPPNGQGASLALEDAAILTRLLVSKPQAEWNAELFARFERIRRPRIKKIRGTTDTSSDAKRKAGPWVWYVKKTVFRAFFWWKGGVFNHFEDNAYDVDGIDIKNA